MHKNLYVSENPYIMYKIIIKAFINKDEKRDLIIADNIDSMLPLADVLKEFKLFERIYIYRYNRLDKYHSMTVERGKNVFTSFLMFMKRYWSATFHQKDLKEDEQLKKVDFYVYNEIYTSDFDVSRINGYLAVNKIYYTLMEHAKYVFDKQNIGLVYNLCTYIAYFLERIHLLTGIRIASQYCRFVEVHEKKNLGKCMKLKKLKVWNIDQEIAKLSVEEKDSIYKIYAKAYQLDLDYSKKYNLLLTNPLALDGVVESIEAQKECYNKIYQEYLDDAYPLIIKPHPRDTCLYDEVFPNAIIVNKDISSEIMNFSSKLKIQKALTFYSTSVEAFKNQAKNIEFISASEPEARQSEFLIKFNKEWRK